MVQFDVVLHLKRMKHDENHDENNEAAAGGAAESSGYRGR